MTSTRKFNRIREGRRVSRYVRARWAGGELDQQRVSALKPGDDLTGKEGEDQSIEEANQGTD